MAALNDLISAVGQWISSSDNAKTALLVLLLTPLLRVAWLAASSAYQRTVEWMGRRIERCPIALGPLPVPPRARSKLADEIPIYCLIVRYGDDGYLERLASDQERFEGRLRLEILCSKLKLDRESCTYSGTIPLKVHRRLGTQFKLFFEVEGPSQVRRYVSALSAMTDIVAEVTTSKYGGKTKVWFLLKCYHFTRIANYASREGGGGGAEKQIRNNFYFPL